MMNYGQLSKIKISGYKSIKECETVQENLISYRLLICCKVC